MMAVMNRTQVLVVAVTLLALSGCTPGQTPPQTPPPTAPVTESATPSPTPAALPDDVLLVISTVATADNGAVLDLSLTVHRPLAFDDPEADPAKALMTDACGGGTDDSIYADNLWTFATVDVEATARPGADWPDGRRIILSPLSTYLALAAEGAVLDDDEVDPETPHCRRDKHLDSGGTGTLVVAFAGDTDDAGAAGQFTKWANHLWGFSGVRVAGQSAQSAGISLSECVYTVTPAGSELHGGADWWIERNTDTTCQVGSPSETKDF